MPLLLGDPVLDVARARRRDRRSSGTVYASTTLAFDIGVYLVVVGLVFMVFEAFGEDDDSSVTGPIDGGDGMSLTLALTAALLFGIGTYLVLQRKLSRIIIGLVAAEPRRRTCCSSRRARVGIPPLIGTGDPADFSDPLPQALALTTIVITFGVTALLLALAYRSWMLSHDDEVEDDVTDRAVGSGGWRRQGSARRGDRRTRAAGTRSSDRGRPRARSGARRSRPAMTQLVPLPILLPLIGAALSIVFGRRRVAQRVIALSVLSATTVISIVLLVVVDRDGPLVMPAGDWPAPIGITLVVDRLSAIMLTVGSVMLLAVLVYAIGQPGRRAQPRRLPVRVPRSSPPGSAASFIDRRPVQPVRRRSR